MNRTNVFVILQFVFICTIINKIYSYENYGEELMRDTFIKNPQIDSDSSLDKQYQYMERRSNFRVPSLANHRPSESAEKYFQWVEKTDRPVEFFRGKRFWLFAKKDDTGASAEYIPSMMSQQNSLTQGLWRSGIVGRRR